VRLCLCDECATAVAVTVCLLFCYYSFIAQSHATHRPPPISPAFFCSVAGQTNKRNWEKEGQKEREEKKASDRHTCHQKVRHCSTVKLR